MGKLDKAVVFESIDEYCEQLKIKSLHYLQDDSFSIHLDNPKTNLEQMEDLLATMKMQHNWDEMPEDVIKSVVKNRELITLDGNLNSIVELGVRLYCFWASVHIWEEYRKAMELAKQKKVEDGRCE